MKRFDSLTLAGVIQERASSQPDFEVLTLEGARVRPDETRTYLSLWNHGLSLAAGLQSLGLKHGDKLATLLANHAEFVDLMLASSLLGVVLVPIDPRTKGDKLVYMIGAANCKSVIVADYAIEELLRVRDKIGSLGSVVCLQTDEGKLHNTEFEALNVKSYTQLTQTSPLGVEFEGSQPEDALELIYTSGTTGDPKGIVMTHRRYVETSSLMPTMFGFKPDDRLYSGLSLTHANAQLITLGTALCNAIPCVLSRRFSKSRLWNITRQYGCTNFTLLGGMITAIYADPVRPDDADNPVRFVISAGMPEAIWSEFQQRFGVEIYEFYGAAEGGLVGNPPGLGPIGSIGKPVPSLQYRLIDDEGQDAVPNAQGERVGELLFRHQDGSPFKVEYFGNPEASAKKCAGGWLHMGDVVREDQDGWLYFMFRKGSGIRRNGEFISSAFIEKVIAQVPEVDDVYVYGIPAATCVPGEKDVVAAVVPKAGQSNAFDVQALFKQCRQSLEPNFVPSVIQVLDQIPKTASEKPQDRFLIEALQTQPSSVHYEQR